MTYGGIDVLHGVDLDIHRGEIFALLGPNGAGKTTTVEILEGFRRRSAGEVSVLGADPERGDDAWRGRIGLVLQSWRDHRRWRVAELLTHFATYYPGPGPLPRGPGGWLTLLWVTTLGLLAVVPLGAAIGAVLPNPREALALIMLPTMGLLITSGTVLPVTSLPVPVQQVAALFPLKWMAQGLRSALLPDTARTAEAAGSWELPMVALVLTAWTVLGFLLAVPLLRRAARRESGSRLSARHRRAARSGALSA
ncbi:ATP-binding cassette domain-containing protein [Streptomyces sp. NPDC017991]|uniref:ATP-binding cassette domain-containing protein n=1 Tax=Streptomyces sp. NPDC017991 TaxID=3365026 RepID=UPI0037A0B323